jgi:predicted phosphodiesterase
MRVAALYDVHGNLPALQAVLADLDDDVQIVSGGDLVAGPLPSECLTLLRERGARFLKGNADRFVLDRSGEDAWAYERLTDAERAEVAGWPASVELDVDGLGRVLFCHGSPRSDEEILSAATPDDVVAEALGGADADVVVGGHTHQQFDRAVGGVRFVNAGSVGLPYEGRAGAFWAVLGPDVELQRSDYDVHAAATELEATGYPRVREYLVSSLLEPLSRDEVTAAHERNAGRGS